MSLADELLADLEEAGDEGEDGLYPGEEGESDGEAGEGHVEGGLEDIPEEMEVDYSGAESVSSIAKLRNSKQVRAVCVEQRAVNILEQGFPNGVLEPPVGACFSCPSTDSNNQLSKL